MRILSFALMAALVGAAPSWAFDEPQKKPPANAAATKDGEDSVADQIRKIQTEFAQKQQDVIKRYRAAQDDAEKQKVLEEYRALQTEQTAQYAALVEKHPDDKAIFPALQALIYSGHADKAVDLLVKHHLDNEQIGTICLQLAMQDTPGGEALVRAVAEKAKSDDAKAMALLGLGQMLLARSNGDSLDDARRTKLRTEAKDALQKVIDHYPDVSAFRRKAGDWASAVLFEAEHLSVGLPVPDLAGEDLEGQEFKLSDYRGKVVFLDFWAHW
ncbi:MAG TPA: hypothetical protein VFI31_11500 [Pirellulales bacterium]|nr:hypothetical protein [Pirellulales bacterium]